MPNRYIQVNAKNLPLLLTILVLLYSANYTISASLKKIEQLKKELSEKETELGMKERVLRTQIKKQKNRYKKLMEDQQEKMELSYNELKETLTEEIKQLKANNKELQIKNERLESGQKILDIMQIQKSSEQRLERMIEQMTEPEELEDKKLLQMKQKSDKKNKFLKKIRNTVESYSPDIKDSDDDEESLLRVSNDIVATYKAKEELSSRLKEMEKMTKEQNKLKNDIIKNTLAEDLKDNIAYKEAKKNNPFWYVIIPITAIISFIIGNKLQPSSTSPSSEDSDDWEFDNEF